MNTISIAIPFALDTELWWTGNGYAETWVECPECAGTKAITMIQGNGTRVSIDCAACSMGYEPPRGVIKQVTHQHKPERYTPRRVKVDGDEIWYSEASPFESGYTQVSAKSLFASKDDCQTACDDLNHQRNLMERKRDVDNLLYKRKKMAWSVHYWGRMLANKQRELETIKARLSVCQEIKKQAKI